MGAIGEEGTVLIWSHHELTTLRDIRRQMELYGHEDNDLAASVGPHRTAQGKWAESRHGGYERPAVHGYFHPSTRAKTSIKFTLPAVLNSHWSKRIPQWLATFEKDVDLLGRDEHGLINPYKLLPAIQLNPDSYGEDEEEDYTVNEGTGAMRAYQDMLYGLAKNSPAKKELLREALRIYCKLDTLAMVVIWEHWRGAGRS